MIVLLRASQITSENQPLSPTKSDKDEPVFNLNSPKAESSDELKDKIKRLELLLIKSKQFVKDQSKQINALTSEKESLKMVNENETTIKLEEERNRFESDYKSAELKINELNIMIAESKDSQIKLNNALNELNEKDVFYKEQIKVMSRDFDEKRTKSETEIKILNESIESLKHQAQNDTKIKDLEELIEKLKEENEAYLKSTNDDQNAKISNFESELNHLRESNETLLNEKTKLDENLLNKENEFKLNFFRLNDTILKLEKEIDSKEQLLTQANNQMKNMRLEAETNLNDIIKPLNEKYLNLKSTINQKFSNSDENCDVGLMIDNFKNNFENKIHQMNDEIEKNQQQVNIEKDNYKLLLEEFNEFKETDFINLKNNFEIEYENLRRKSEKVLIENEVN